MAHPFAGQAKASQKARLGRLGAKAGKSHGASSMYKQKSLPKKNAGSSTPMTISGGSAKSRPDRFAFGGSVGDKGKKKRKPGATTNIIISHAGGRGGSGGGGGAGPPPGGGPGGPVPVPVPRPVPVPVNAGPGGVPPEAGPGPIPPVMRPPMGPPPMPAGPPPGGPPMRPPGMKAGGAVMKAAKGGFLKDSPGKGYAGFPHSPTSKAGSAVSAHKKGGAVGKFAEGGLTDVEETGMKKGGGVKKLQFGGGAGGQMGLGGGAQAPAAPPGGAGLMGVFPGRGPVPEQQGPPTVSGRPMVPAQALTVPQPKMGSSVFQRPAPGTTVGFKKGGKVPAHEDEAQDKKLITKMIAKKKDGGGLSPYSDKGKYHQQGKGYASGGSVQAGAGSGVGRLARSK